MKKYLSFLLFLLIVGALAGCRETDSPSRNTVVVDVVANTSLRTWLDAAVDEFNNSRVENADKRVIFIEVTYQEVGESIPTFQDGHLDADVWIPDTSVWTTIAADQGVTQFDQCTSVAQSPLVIAMWTPIAEALGWPGRDLGWLDLGSLAADPSAWEYYSGGQYGPTFRLGHTHPRLSSSGAYTMLAVVQAAQSQLEAVSENALEQAVVQASVGAFEGSVSFFSPSPVALADLLEERGSSYLGAAIIYRHQVLELQQAGFEVASVMPFEGTYWADNPACINSNSADQAEAGQFVDYLLGEDAQQMASAWEMSIDSQDEMVAAFELPNAELIYGIQNLWETAKKEVNLVMVIDTSGSMQGEKIENVRNSAIQFIQEMNKDDYITILTYKYPTGVEEFLPQTRVGDARDKIISSLNKVKAQGDTPLYDSIGEGITLLHNEGSPQWNNLLVVLTDGEDTSSERWILDSNFYDYITKDGFALYTIAYGNDANEEVLEKIALSTNGVFYLSSEADIAQIYEEMSILFGGNVGIGR